MKSDAIKARIQARSSISYSETWRDRWAAVRAKNNATDAMHLADLSTADLEKWKRDAHADFASAVNFVGQQCRTLRQMFDKLQTQYVKLADDRALQRALVDLGDVASRRSASAPLAACWRRPRSWSMKKLYTDSIRRNDVRAGV